MNVVLPILMFLVGFAAGTGIVFFFSRKSAYASLEHERCLSQVEIRAAEGRVAERDARITELQSAGLSKDNDIRQRGEETLQLKQDIAVLQTELRNEKEKTPEKLGLLHDVEEKFLLKLSKPVQETLKELDTKIAVYDNNATNLGTVTSKLVKALQKPEVRGQWGEMALERVLEVTGMTEGQDYEKQLVIGEDGQKRPDFVVHIAGGKNLVIDAKAPIQAFLDAAEATEEDVRVARLKAFSTHVRDCIKKLGVKKYHQDLPDSPEFVVLYLPSEAIFSAAQSLDRELLEYAYGQRVLLAGPTILISLLLAVAHGWKQEAVATNSREISELAKELYKRLSTFGGHMCDLGKQLNKSVEAYDAAVGSLDRNVMPQARRFEKLGATTSGIKVPELTSIEKSTRKLQSPEFSHDDSDGELEEADTLARPR